MAVVRRAIEAPLDARRPRVELLGLPRLVLHDAQPHVLERRDAALLALLVLQGPTSRHRVVGLLWPDLPLRAAQSNLRQRLFRLKQRVGSAIVVAEPAMMLADGIQHDLTPEIGTLAHLPDDAERPLLGSLEYDDCGELAEWVARARERWAGERREQWARHAAALEAEGRIAEALACAERLAVEAPTAEHAHRRVMRLHYRRGDRAAALGAFERCRERLARELGTRPSPETLELAALIERSTTLPPPVLAPNPVAILRPPRLIGREREWAAIHAAWQRRQPVLLLGEPGIGKSRLAGDCAAARPQHQVFRAHPGDAHLHHSLLSRVLRGLLARLGPLPQGWIGAEFSRLLPELGPPPAGRLEPLHLRRAVDEAMAHWQQRGLELLVLDDLHFADAASLEWLGAWLAQGRHPLVIMAARPGVAAWAGWPGSHEPDVGGVCEIALAPLDHAAVATLLDSLDIPGLTAAAWAGPLFRHTGGNPLFILETLKTELARHPTPAGDGPITLTAPAHIGKLLDHRLAQLTAAALRLARVGALSGPDFSVALAASVLGVSALDLADAWSELQRAQVISDTVFAHDLILDATLRSVPDAIAQALHGSIAVQLELGDREPARIANHWRQAREWARAAPLFERAARAAHAASRPADALELWNAAVACHERAGNAGAAFEARCLAVDSAIVVSPANAVQARVEALLADAASDAGRLCALIAKARHLATATQFRDVLAVTAEALALARGLNDLRRELVVVNLRGVALSMTGQGAEGLALFENMAGAVDNDNDGDPTAACEFCGAFGYALYAAGRFRESMTWFERAAELAGQLGETNLLAINLGNLSGLLARLGRHDRALDAAERAYAAQLRLGKLQGVPYAVSLLNLGMCRLYAGRFGKAIADLLKALELARTGEAHSLAANVENHLAGAYLMLGQPARAHQTLTPLADDAPVQVRARRAIVGWRITSFAGAASAQNLMRVLEQHGTEGTTMDRLGLELAVAAALDASECAAWSRRTREAAVAHDHPPVALTALIRLADAQRRLGDLDGAAASARAAVAESAQSGWYDLPAPEFWWMAFQALDAAGWADEATGALREGSRWIGAAVDHVPDEFRNSYLHRSRAVPQMMAMAKRRLAS